MKTANLLFFFFFNIFFLSINIIDTGIQWYKIVRYLA